MTECKTRLENFPARETGNTSWRVSRCERWRFSLRRVDSTNLFEVRHAEVERDGLGGEARLVFILQRYPDVASCAAWATNHDSPRDNNTIVSRGSPCHSCDLTRANAGLREAAHGRVGHLKRRRRHRDACLVDARCDGVPSTGQRGATVSHKEWKAATRWIDQETKRASAERQREEHEQCLRVVSPRNHKLACRHTPIVRRGFVEGPALGQVLRER